jgi:hypothetical protein
MISVELMGESSDLFDADFVKHAAASVFHYFKKELDRERVSVAEFVGALEKVLRGFALTAQLPQPASANVLELDLRRLACGSHEAYELFFFPRLRDELRDRLKLSPQVVHFQGLRGCVKQLLGARRWCSRCRSLHEQIIEFLRNCMSAEADHGDCALLVR